jgi:hypothetical protein
MKPSATQTAKMPHLNRVRPLLDTRQMSGISTTDQEKIAMEQKTARLTVLIDPTKKDAFEQLCAAQDVTPSQIVRQLIREYLEKHGTTYANQPTNGTGSK